MDTWQSLGSAIDFGASGRYRGITDSAGLAKNTVELHMQCSITAGHPLRQLGVSTSGGGTARFEVRHCVIGAAVRSWVQLS